MRRSVSTIAVGLAFSLLPCAFAQAPNGITTPRLVKLSPPIYPALARIARIDGDVKVQLSIGKDGTIESAAVVSGHPLLKPDVLESAQKSTFEFSGCRADGNPYSLIYSFRLRDDNGNCGRVEIDKEWQVRSFKCLYLWKCSVRRTFRSTYAGPQIEVTQSQNHVTILANLPCIETEASQQR